MIDHAPADLWIVPLGTKCFEDSSLLDEGDRYRALSVEGVAEVLPILISFAQWRMPDGSTTPVLVVGSDLHANGLRPWNLVGTAVSMRCPYRTRLRLIAPMRTDWVSRAWGTRPK